MMIMTWIRGAVTDYLRREQGSSTEYALLLAMASAAVAAAMLALGVHVGDSAVGVGKCLSKAPDCTITVTIKTK